MAVSELRLTLDQFYDITPRAFIAMLDEWKRVQVYKAQCQAHIANGGDASDFLPPEPEPVYNVANIL